jgi:diaminopimelate epimerase
MLVWERGVGVTEACGTGACAAAHLAHEWGMVGDVVEVRMPGGSVTVELVEGRAILRGPTVLVADLELTEGVVLDG